MHHIFFIHSSVNGHLGCFHVLAIVNSAAVNIGDDTTLMAESEEELKSLLMKVKVESEKVGLKLNI